MKFLFSIVIVLRFISLHAQPVSFETPELKTARGHQMQYFISLPAGWSNYKKWPVVVIIESADKEYKLNMMRFMQARKNMPFILVAPFNVIIAAMGEEMLIYFHIVKKPGISLIK